MIIKIIHLMGSPVFLLDLQPMIFYVKNNVLYEVKIQLIGFYIISGSCYFFSIQQRYF